MNSYGLDNSQVMDLSVWRAMQERIKRFQNKASLSTFKDIFGEQEALRLFEHFKLNCDSYYEKFKTYLIVEQHNVLLVHIIKSKHYD